MEKYGETPKRFTKAWWSYFWYYYKWHTLGTLLVIFVVAVTCTECAMRPEYDVTVTYAGDMIFLDPTVDKLRAELSEHIDDVDGNGKVMADFQSFNIAKDGTNQAGTEYNGAMLTKVALEFQTGDTYVFLFNRQELDRLLNRSSQEQIFVPLSEWAEGDMSSFKTAKQNGVDYAVNITDSKFFSQKLGLTMGDSLYIAVRRMRPRDTDDERQKKMYEQSIKLANYILENN